MNKLYQSYMVTDAMNRYDSLERMSDKSITARIIIWGILAVAVIVAPIIYNIIHWWGK